ncbi:MAG TPA: hypothetical protein VKV29_00510 [Chthonomonas sp.]|uniref:hypothetical protein n=1 Tax=Chthonomonas sp. TaxID=2282153 RepID=UPI002B4B0AEA|nr:hypothetical protein [Chthonomonas sp.]HLH78745.1 hypothetical protein [Chthonomonas sp.]
MTLPEPIAAACKPLFEAVPLEQAMPHLLGTHPHHVELVRQVLQEPALCDRPDLAAGLWLYVDDLERCHAICQNLPDPTGAFWHGIMHRREGDFANSHYWMRRAASHPLLRERPELKPAEFIDLVAKAGGRDLPELVARQRDEWLALFEWCAQNPLR